MFENRKWVIVNVSDSCFDSMTTYSHSEIRAELAKSDWTSGE